MRSYEIKKEIKLNEEFDRKWCFLQNVYAIWNTEEFRQQSLKIIENQNEEPHDIYVGIQEEEFLLYTYFIDIKEIKFVGKHVDGIYNYNDNELVLTYYDKSHNAVCENIIDSCKSEFENIPNFELRSYFFVPSGYDDEFYYKLISFIYYLSEINVKGNGINICDRKGNFIKYFDLKFPKFNLNKFYYYDKNIFIGSHARNGMIVVYNLPKNKLLELRQWVNSYKSS